MNQFLMIPILNLFRKFGNQTIHPSHGFRCFLRQIIESTYNLTRLSFPRLYDFMTNIISFNWHILIGFILYIFQTMKMDVPLNITSANFYKWTDNLSILFWNAAKSFNPTPIVHMHKDSFNIIIGMVGC